MRCLILYPVILRFISGNTYDFNKYRNTAVALEPKIENPPLDALRRHNFVYNTFVDIIIRQETIKWSSKTTFFVNKNKTITGQTIWFPIVDYSLYFYSGIWVLKVRLTSYRSRPTYQAKISLWRTQLHTSFQIRLSDSDW